MKIVIRGARETGKTSLLRRLEGRSFLLEHLPTPQIQVAHIDWNYKTTSDLVQVEVWDVVDKGITNIAQDARMRALIESGKLPASALPGARVADASTVNVYKGCHAVLVVFDPTRKWTFDYAKAELEKVPKTCQVLLMANFRDLNNRRQVSENEIENHLRACESNVNYIECCMMNGYGLKQLYNWLNIPFLLLKQQSLRHELEMAEKELKTAQHEAQLVQEQDYDSYLKLVNMQMKLQNRPPIPAQGPVPTTQKPGSQEQKGASQPAAGPKASRSAASARAPAAAVGGGRTASRAAVAPAPGRGRKTKPAAKAPSPRPIAGGDDDDLDNFNAGELNDGFFGDDDDEPEEKAYAEEQKEQKAAGDEDDDDSDVPPNDDDDDDGELEMHEAIETRAYESSPAQALKDSSEKKRHKQMKDDDDDDDDLDNFVPDAGGDEGGRGDTSAPVRSDVLSDPVDHEDDDDDDDELPVAHVPVRPQHQPVPLPEPEDEDGDDDELEIADAKHQIPEQESKKDRAESLEDDGLNFVPSGGGGGDLKGFYDDDGDDDDDGEQKSVPTRSNPNRFAQDTNADDDDISAPAFGNTKVGYDDMDPDEGDDYAEVKAAPVDQGPSEYAGVAEIPDKPAKKKKKKKKKDRDSEDGTKKKKKKKKKDKSKSKKESVE